MRSRLSINWIPKSTVLGLLLLGALLQWQSGLAFGPPPVINGQPVDQVVVEGGSATFVVEVSSPTTLSYQWRKDGINIAGATEGAYTISPVSATDAGQYSVSVANGGGMVTSAEAALVVLTPPTITTPPQGQAVAVGQAATFSIAAGGSAPLSYQWHFDGAPLPGATNATLNLPNVQAEMAGEYLVEVTNPYGSVISTAAALVIQSWVATYNGSEDNDDYLEATVIDAQGNVYVTGYARRSQSGTYDYVTLKYDASGNQLWRKVLDRGGDDKACALAIDPSGNVCVTGSSYDENGDGDDGWDYVTVKYDAEGTRLWTAHYNAPPNADEFANSIAVGADGSIVVTGIGTRSDGNYRYQTVKYNEAGNRLWVRHYIGPAAQEACANSVTLDAAGNVYVTGYSRGNTTGLDYATIKYASDGTQLWVARHNGSSSRDDLAAQVVVDEAQNVYVTGSAVSDIGGIGYTTVKYDSFGTQLWVSRYDGEDKKPDKAIALALDGAGNVIVTGWSLLRIGPADFATVKYSPLGDQLWVARYDGPAAGDDMATALAVDATGDIYVTGNSRGFGTDYDFATVKYLNSDGNEAWVARFDSLATNAPAVAVAVDDQLNVYVGGQAYDPLDYTLLKYQSSPSPAGASAPITVFTDGASGMSAEGFSFGLCAPLGSTFVIEASSNGRDWTPIATNVADSASIVFTDPAAANFPSRFYRASVQ